MRTITQYQANDGRMFDSQQECRKHDASLDALDHECPKCRTAGTMKGEAITERQRDYASEGYLGQFAPPQYMTVVVGHKNVPCDVCRGRGWTASEKRPITRTEIIGYE